MKHNLLSALLLLAGLGSAEIASAQTQVFVQWPLKRNNADSTQVRVPATGLTVPTPIFKRLVLSNGLPGTTTAAFAPYSSIGQAFATLATGATGSTNTPGGPRRAFFEQFAITNSGTTALRVDSLLFTASTTNSANGRVALSYSTSGFTTDSIDLSGGAKGPSGVLATTANGNFGTATSSQPAVAPIVLPQYVAGAAAVASTFRVAFVSGGTGVSIAAGRTLTVRLYFRVGSDTEGRYFLLRNVTLKSTQAVLATRSAVKTNMAVYPNPAYNSLTVPHTAANRESHVTVFNTTGAKVADFAAQPGTTETPIDLSNLTKGLYLVEYADGSQRSSARIVKE
jgi:pectinesterase